ncbi:MAG: hypothetical protein AAGM45_17095 [Cyanobacteria bacterium J06588_5]
MQDRHQSEDELVDDIRHRLDQSLQQLSLGRLRVLADFAAYLAEDESEAATQELMAIPGLLERISSNKSTPVDHYADWRALRSDV